MKNQTVNGRHGINIKIRLPQAKHKQDTWYLEGFNPSAHLPSGDICIEGHWQDQWIPLMVRASGRDFYGFDYNQSLDAMQKENFYAQPKPWALRLPFHYHRIPAWMRLKIAQWQTTKTTSSTTHLNLSLDDLKLLSPSQLKPWPSGCRMAFCSTHDVDTLAGYKQIPHFIDIEERLGVRATYHIVPCYYPFEIRQLQLWQDNGFEFGMHGYRHDGRLPFKKTSAIKALLDKGLDKLHPLSIRGFRSPNLFRTPALFESLQGRFIYDSSRPVNDNYRGSNSTGVKTSQPYRDGQLLEIPLSLPQDADLIFRKLPAQQILTIWKESLNEIADKGGVAVLNTHPDPWFSGNPAMLDIYQQLLTYVKQRKDIWMSTMGQVADHLLNPNDTPHAHTLSDRTARL